MNITINSEEQRKRAAEAILSADLSQPLSMTLKPFQPRRTLPMNALYWQWLTYMAKHFSEKAGPFSKDDMHDLMKHQFLGYAPARKISRTDIPAQLKSTASLTKGEMLAYMEKIDAWAADHGCLLPRPGDSEYDQMREAQNV